jgi:hypothetical protein
MKKILLSLLVLMAIVSVNAQSTTINLLSDTYSQDFNGLASTGATGTVLPTNWFSTVSSYRVGNGSTNNGGLYSFGDSAVAERALGSVGSGSAAPIYGVKFLNNTNAIINTINVAYIAEQWRLGQKPAVRLDSTLFSYNIGVDSLNTAGWVNVSSLKMVSSDTTASSAGKLNGNVAPNRKVVSGSITGLSIPIGSTFWLRWSERDVLGSDDGLAVDSLRLSFAGSVPVACVAPTASATNLVLTPAGNSVSGTFTASATATKYLVVRSTSATLSSTPANGTLYAAGSAFGGGTVVQNSASTSFTASGLTAATQYYFFVFAFNDACVGEPFYRTTALSGSTTTTCGEPNDATNLVFSPVTNNSIAGHFTKSVPAAAGYVVVYSTSTNIAYPLDSTTYAVNDSIINGSNKSKVAYVGTDSNFSVTGLLSGTRYYFAVIPYANCPGFINYNRTTPLRDDTITGGTAPLTDCSNPVGVSANTIIKLDSTTSTISIKWKNSVSDSVLVFAAPTNTIGFVTIRDSAYYLQGTTIPTNGATPPLVYYRGTDSSVVLTGLQANTVYKIFVVSFNNKNCTFGPNYGGLANVLIRTAAGTDCQDPTGVSTTSIIKIDSTTNSISIKWTNPANSDSVLVFAAPVTTVGFVTLHDSVYYAVGSTIPSSGATQPKVYYRGTDSSTVLTGLTSSTVYKIFVVSFKNKNCTNGPNYSGLAFTTIKTRTLTGVRNNTNQVAFKLFPNPTKDLLNLEFEKNINGNTNVTIFDNVGRNVYSNSYNVTNQLQINLPSLAKGIYIINLENKDFTAVKTFIVE